MNIVIIDYGSGNLRSAAKAFERVAEGQITGSGRAQHFATGHKVTVTSDPAALAHASHIVLPGVGAFGDCMRGLSSLPGMLEALEREVRKKQKPFFGICVGMQMMFERGFEHGEHKGLGWMKGDVVPLTGSGRAEPGATGYNITGSGRADHPTTELKIPHMGWNNLTLRQPEHPALAGIKNGEHAYFVHSYHAQCKNSGDILATVEYGGPVVALVGRGNLLGAQFHPEKSQETGLKLIANFLKME